MIRVVKYGIIKVYDTLEYNLKDMIQPTEKQKRAADNIIKMKLNGNVDKGKALRDAGYSAETSHTPQLVTESKGFRAYMDSAGINEESIAVMLSEDLRGKPKERLGELKLAAELLGLTNKDINVVFNEKVSEQLNDLGKYIDGEDETDLIVDTYDAEGKELK